jgi:hypothetical protein
MSAAKRAAAIALSLVALLIAASTCSLGNHEGPDVTCESLQCGKINACRDGIIASCADGKTVKFHVCLDTAQDICDEDWQVSGQYKCDEFMAECEGCRPERTGCPTESDAGVPDSGGGSGGGNGGAGGNGGGAGGT